MSETSYSKPGKIIRTQMSTDCRLLTLYQQRCEKKILTRISRNDFREIPIYFNVCSVCTTCVRELVKTCIRNRQNVRSVEGHKWKTSNR